MADVGHLGFFVCIWTTHDVYFVVSIISQNVVRIDAVVLII